ncbi:hypothetical protein DSO57_1024112 [Entomophthora muscae]|uniref:Uncharacterized protein n=1 Tax=Entomophthora muscae TaxID=34485 RepID=A0ACC2T319_9FUNG|nr:hypothetical protein DSO57_1024112 [Entomophthora muscae]
MRNAESQVMDNLPQITDTQGKKTLESSKTLSTESKTPLKSENNSLPHGKNRAPCPDLRPASNEYRPPVNHAADALNMLKNSGGFESNCLPIDKPEFSSSKSNSATKPSNLDKEKISQILDKISQKSVGPPISAISKKGKEDDPKPDINIKRDVIEKVNPKASETEVRASIAAIPLSFVGPAFSGEVAALGNLSSQPSGKPKPSLKDVLYSSNSSQPPFPVVFPDRAGPKQGSNFSTLSSVSSTGQFPDSLLRPLAAQNNIPMSIALPLPLVARQTNEPQLIKALPGGVTRGISNNQSSFNQSLANFSSARPSLIHNRLAQDLEPKRSSPSFDSFENDEELSGSPRKSKRPRKYIRSGKYSKMKSKGSEGECSPGPSSGPWTPAVSQPPHISSSDNPALNSYDPFTNTKPEQEVQHHYSIKEKVSQSLKSDEAMVAAPDLSRPFEGLEDAFNRLIPYHLYQYPDESVEEESGADFNASKIINSYRSFKAHMSTLATRLRNEEKRVLPLSVLIDHLLAKDAPTPKVAPLSIVSNGPSSTMPIAPHLERLSSAAPSEPTNE